MYLILIDAHSKWIEAFNTPTATSAAVINELRTTFARFGIPETVVTDNGTCFVSSEFEQFLDKNGIRHITSAPYHPASNGLAERAVQIIKKGLKKQAEGSVAHRLAKVLLSYRITPQGTTGVSPAELLLGRRPRTVLDLVKPHTAERVEHKQQQQKARHDASARERTFKVGDLVWMKNHGPGDNWLPGTVDASAGPVNFTVKLDDGRLRKCHTEQLRRRQAPNPEVAQPERAAPAPVVPAGDVPAEVPTTALAPEVSSSPERPPSPGPTLPNPAPVTSGNAPVSITPAAPEPATITPARKQYPVRDRKP